MRGSLEERKRNKMELVNAVVSYYFRMFLLPFTIYSPNNFPRNFISSLLIKDPNFYLGRSFIEILCTSYSTYF